MEAAIDLGLVSSDYKTTFCQDFLHTGAFKCPQRWLNACVDGTQRQSLYSDDVDGLDVMLRNCVSFHEGSHHPSG